MINRLIVFLVRKKLGLKKYETFRFTTQRKNNMDVYTFGYRGLYKVHDYYYEQSGVSLNYLLSDECKIEKVEA